MHRARSATLRSWRHALAQWSQASAQSLQAAMHEETCSWAICKISVAKPLSAAGTALDRGDFGTLKCKRSFTVPNWPPVTSGAREPSKAVT